MAAHRGANFFEIHDCSGYSLGTNKERYFDINILALTLKCGYALNGWVYATPKKAYPTFHCLGPHGMEQAHCLIKELYIVSVPQFKQDSSLYPILLEEISSMVMYHHYVGTHIDHKEYVYTKLHKCSKKPKPIISTVLLISH